MTPRPIRGIRAWRNPLWQLTLQNVYAQTRAGLSLFFTLALPALLAVVLSIAFAPGDGDRMRPTVAVAATPGDEPLITQLRTREEVRVLRLDEADARRRLAKGAISMVVRPGDPPELSYDPKDPYGQITRVVVGAALTPATAAGDRTFVEAHMTIPPGPRYIDFLIPGLTAFSIFGIAMTLPMSLVWMRSGRLLKRLIASPMRRHHFLLAFALSRALFAIVLSFYMVGFAWLCFDVQLKGSLLTMLLLSTVGTLSFVGLGVLIGSRTEHPETIGGIAGLTNLVLMVGSGAFFPIDNFPALIRPVLKALPMSPLAEGLRAVMLDGAGLADLGRPLLILGVQAVAFFLIGLKLFRWS